MTNQIGYSALDSCRPGTVPEMTSKTVVGATFSFAANAVGVVPFMRIEALINSGCMASAILVEVSF
ncbi:hypothetical protein WJ970_24320 [Achromobacter xylosoxidans]